MNIRNRFHCEFKDCNCQNFTHRYDKLCYVCRHSHIWHSKTSKPPTDEYLSFCSSRKMADRPIYTSVSPIQIAIFVPEAKAIVESVDQNRYCPDTILLPI